MLDLNQMRVEVKTCDLDLLIQRMRKNEVAFKLPVGTAWDKTKQSRFIESLLIGFPTPYVWYECKPNNDWVVIDGHKRLSTILNFVEGRLVLQDMEFLPYNGFTYDTLPRPMQRSINETYISIVLIRSGLPDDIRANIFTRLEKNPNQFI
jgi:hypothetical protein